MGEKVSQADLREEEISGEGLLWSVGVLHGLAHRLLDDLLARAMLDSAGHDDSLLDNLEDGRKTLLGLEQILLLFVKRFSFRVMIYPTAPNL